ncbi:LysR substrate-binding domain-containing protein [Siccirubricoccus deserti]
MSEDVGLAIIPLLPRLRAAAPHCRVVIRAANYLTIPGLLDAGEIGTAIGYFEDLPAAAKQRVLRRDGFRVLRDATSPGPIDLESYCARPHLLVTPRGDLTGFVDELLKQMGRRRQVVLGMPDRAAAADAARLRPALRRLRGAGRGADGDQIRRDACRRPAPSLARIGHPHGLANCAGPRSRGGLVARPAHPLADAARLIRRRQRLPPSGVVWPSAAETWP